jgi:hypothetical protein
VTKADILFWAQLAGIAVQFLSLIFLIVYVIKTWEMASATRVAAEATQGSVAEMRETRDQQTAPYIIVYFDVPFGTSLIYLVVKNIGSTIASDVKLDFTPPLSASDGNNIREASFVKDGIAAMPPGYEIRALFDTGPSYFGNPDLPLKYQVRVTYLGGINNASRTLNQTLDLSVRKGVLYVRPKTIENVADELEKIRRELEHTRDSSQHLASTLSNGIALTNPSLFLETVETELPKWSRALASKLREFELMWTVEYAEQRATGYDQSKILSYSRQTSRQILLLLSKAPEESPAELVTAALSLAKDIHDLGMRRFYADGGTAIKAFNEAGDEIVRKIVSFVVSLAEPSDEQPASAPATDA